MSPYVDWMRFSILCFSFIKKKKNYVFSNIPRSVVCRTGKNQMFSHFSLNINFVSIIFPAPSSSFCPSFLSPNLLIFLPLLLLLPLF